MNSKWANSLRNSNNVEYLKPVQQNQFCRGLRISLQRKILIQFCISMLGLYLAFLIGIDRTHSEVGCLIVAALLHYFVVTTVLWMGVEARHMYITLVTESGRVSRKFLIKAGFFAWGKRKSFHQM